MNGRDSCQVSPLESTDDRTNDKLTYKQMLTSSKPAKDQGKSILGAPDTHTHADKGGGHGTFPRSCRPAGGAFHSRVGSPRAPPGDRRAGPHPWTEPPRVPTSQRPARRAGRMEPELAAPRSSRVPEAEPVPAPSPSPRPALAAGRAARREHRGLSRAGRWDPASLPSRVAHLSCPHPRRPTSSRCPRLRSCSPRSPRSPPPSHRDDSSPSYRLGNGPAFSSRAVASHSLLPARPLPLRGRARRTPRITRPQSSLRNPRLLPTPGPGLTT